MISTSLHIHLPLQTTMLPSMLHRICVQMRPKRNLHNVQAGVWRLQWQTSCAVLASTRLHSLRDAPRSKPREHRSASTSIFTCIHVPTIKVFVCECILPCSDLHRLQLQIFPGPLSLCNTLWDFLHLKSVRTASEFQPNSVKPFCARGYPHICVCVKPGQLRVEAVAASHCPCSEITKILL